MATTLVIRKELAYALIAIAIVSIILLNVYAFSRKDNSVVKTADNFNKFKAAENPDDKCATPSGYTDEQWKEHMGHHPDMYAECLE